jgi:hypothetical protein
MARLHMRCPQATAASALLKSWKPSRVRAVRSDDEAGSKSYAPLHRNAIRVTTSPGFVLRNARGLRWGRRVVSLRPCSQ